MEKMKRDINDEIRRVEGDYQRINLLIKKKKLEEAETLAQGIFEISHKGGSIETAIYSRIIEATLLIYRRHFDRGFLLFHEALTMAESIDNEALAVEINAQLGKWYCEFNELDKAISILSKIVEHHPLEHHAINSLAIAYARKRDFNQAVYYFQKKYEISKKLHLDHDLSISASNLGLCFTSLQRFEEALNIFQEALEIDLRLGNQNRICNVYNSIANVYIQKQSWEMALEFAKKGLALALKIPSEEETERAYNNLYIIYKTTGQHTQAYENIDKCRELQMKRSNLLMAERIQDLEKLIRYERDDYRKKEKELQKSNEIFRLKFEHFQSAYKDLLNIGEIGVFSDKIKTILDMAYFFHQDRNIPVLIEGETGTGKEIIARVVHFGKEGDIRPFISINCSAISPSLFESELFGYEEGAFTGAKTGGMIGKLELAQGGTLFLDEIGEMPIELQSKLLRVIQQREFYRISGRQSIKLDVRIICATNRDLKMEMEEKRFRPDLYYRLMTGRIFIPPLRERKEEIAPLSQMFMQRFTEEKKKNFRYIDTEVIRYFEDYKWPGNVRELQNSIERIIILNNDIIIRKEHLSFFNLPDKELKTTPKSIIQIPLNETGMDIRDIQKLVMKQVLDKFEGNKTKTAEYLNIARKTLYLNNIE